MIKNLRIAFMLIVFIAIFSGVNAKKGDNLKSESLSFDFEDINVLPNTFVKDQNKTGTCWSFSALSFFESEMLRLGKSEVDLSEMFIVWHTYSEKAKKYVRLHGNLNFSPGGAFHDVTNMIRKYGIVPESVYDGLNYGEEKHIHGEMDKVLKEFVKSITENKNRQLTSVWHESLEGVLNNYLGGIPETFEFEGKKYTPQTFASDYVGLDINNYIEIASYNHHPFYSEFILEVPDNWSWDKVYNVPLAEMQEIIDNSIEKGYTVAWASDISEKGFTTRDLGVALVDNINSENDLDKTDDNLNGTKARFLQKEITQEMRQEAFDNYQTTDDHGMHIIGTAKDQFGNEFYKIKNSWGEYNKYDGLFYASKPYVKYKTTCIMVHKDAVPKHIRKKLNL